MSLLVVEMTACSTINNSPNIEEFAKKHNCWGAFNRGFECGRRNK